ncbi:MAG: IPTL-CTERM sorting domain-containing protein [Xanthomonadales bacterium]|nr:IPTL-CTERM sorting domain-containing protein [Xanthomonadales bacterium]
MNMKRAIMLSVLGAVMLPSLAMAQIDTRATFAVTKTFADGNDVDEVTISIDCNTGVILDQDKVLGDGDSVEFVVTSYTAGTLNCSIDEGDVTDGYSASYSGDGIAGGCEWSAIPNGGEYECDIVNSPDEVEIVVTKNWVIEGDNNNVNLGYEVYAWCNNIFDDEVSEEVSNHNSYYQIGWDSSEGPVSDTFTFFVRPGFPSSDCYVYENVYDSAIEVDNGCDNLNVSAGEGDSCVITNTVFFEGIPTLSQYGMAIMALLMLGVGFVGFRRFV